MHILVVEDEQRLGRLLRRSLESARHVVDVATDGETGLAAARGSAYDAIILDLGLPDIDGIEVCRQVRVAGVATPILMLTARDEVQDRVQGLDAGADDYLGKPFALSELLARVRALSRRQQPEETMGALHLDDLRLDVPGRRAWRGDRPLTLSAKEFALLEFMLRHAGQVLTRQQIIEHVWRYDFDGLDTIVDTYIHYLRDKVDAKNAVRLVKTVRGVGYVLRAD